MNELIYYDLKGTTGLTHSLSAQVSRDLGRRIVSSQYPTGSLLEDEAALAARYQVSRSVIRDAVKILAGKGLLEVRRGIGTRVRDRSNWGLLDDDVLAWHQAAAPNPMILRQLLDVRRAIEPKAARWAAESGSDDDIGAIVAAQQEMEKDKESIEDYIGADARFHRAILRATGNDFLRAMEGIIITALLNSIRLTNKDPRENAASIPFHRAIAEAVRNRDGKAAEKRMEEHLADTLKRLESYQS